jgi:hypothetical protein
LDLEVNIWDEKDSPNNNILFLEEEGKKPELIGATFNKLIEWITSDRSGMWFFFPSSTYILFKEHIDSSSSKRNGISNFDISTWNLADLALRNVFFKTYRMFATSESVMQKLVER